MFMAIGFVILLLRFTIPGIFQMIHFLYNKQNQYNVEKQGATKSFLIMTVITSYTL